MDFFVRNTSTDGDALSVKEALFLGVPTICTDVVDRPKGVMLFKYCDRDSFENCLMDKKKDNVAIENGAEQIVQLYRCNSGWGNNINNKNELSHESVGSYRSDYCANKDYLKNECSDNEYIR